MQISAIGADADSASAYARTKAAGEAAVRAAFPTPRSCGPRIVFGPEDDFFNRFASDGAALAGAAADRRRQDEVPAGLCRRRRRRRSLRCVEDPQRQGKTYELGGPGVSTASASCCG